MDLFLTSQWPLGIDEALSMSKALPEMKQIFHNSSSSLAAVIDLIKPRYIYSSQLDTYHKRQPFLLSNGVPCRFIALGSLPGKHKSADSKEVYIQAIELEPLSKVSKIEDIIGVTDDCEKSSPYSIIL